MTTDVVGMMGSFAFQWLALKCSTTHTQVQLHNILHKQTLRLQRMGWRAQAHHQRRLLGSQAGRPGHCQAPQSGPPDASAGRPVPQQEAWWGDTYGV